MIYVLIYVLIYADLFWFMLIYVDLCDLCFDLWWFMLIYIDLFSLVYFLKD